MTTQSEQAKALLEETLSQCLASTLPVHDLTLIADVKEFIELLVNRQDSYRDAWILQLAYALSAASLPCDVTQRHEGARSVASWLGSFLQTHHIRAVKDCFQNIGKNSPQLVRGNNERFDSLLKWAAKQTNRANLDAAFRFSCSRVAAQARPVTPMPPLNRGALTFAALARLIDGMLLRPSGGAHEQFVVAALLTGSVDQYGLTGVRVETKNLNASDRSSRTAGDVQLIGGGRVLEAFEVTANDWREKIAGAARTIREADLSRLTLVGRNVPLRGQDLHSEISATGLDLTVVDVSAFCWSLTAGLTKNGRETALVRLYELLDRNQPNVDLVNSFVADLHDQGLT
jgi:hypothetical protein